MKILQQFKVLYIFNLIIYFLLLSEFLFDFFSKEKSTPNKVFAFISINTIIFFLVLYFTKICFILVQTAENNVGITLKKITKSNIIAVLYCTYTVLLFMGSFAIVRSYLQDWKFIKQDILLIIRGIFFIMFTFTSLCCGIIYFLLRKKIMNQFDERLNSFGNKEN